jgi:hypothetical protein
MGFAEYGILPGGITRNNKFEDAVLMYKNIWNGYGILRFQTGMLSQVWYGLFLTEDTTDDSKNC